MRVSWDVHDEGFGRAVINTLSLLKHHRQEFSMGIAVSRAGEIYHSPACQIVNENLLSQHLSRQNEKSIQTAYVPLRMPYVEAVRYTGSPLAAVVCSDAGE